MSNKLITSAMLEEVRIQHHGVKGMKWGFIKKEETNPNQKVSKASNEIKTDDDPHSLIYRMFGSKEIEEKEKYELISNSYGHFLIRVYTDDDPNSNYYLQLSSEEFTALKNSKKTVGAIIRDRKSARKISNDQESVKKEEPKIKQQVIKEKKIQEKILTENILTEKILTEQILKEQVLKEKSSIGKSLDITKNTIKKSANLVTTNTKKLVIEIAPSKISAGKKWIINLFK